MTMEEAQQKIAVLSADLNAVIEKGWVCGETRSPLSEEHVQRLVAEAQVKADAIAKEVEA